MAKLKTKTKTYYLYRVSVVAKILGVHTSNFKQWRKFGIVPKSIFCRKIQSKIKGKQEEFIEELYCEEQILVIKTWFEEFAKNKRVDMIRSKGQQYILHKRFNELQSNICKDIGL